MRVEILVAVGVLMGVSLMAARVLRGWAFCIVVGALIPVLCTDSMQGFLWPMIGLVRLRWILLGTGLATALGIRLMRTYFFTLLVTFSLGAFSVDVMQSVWRRLNPEAKAVARPAGQGGAPAHVIHIVFDAQIGLAGLPEDIAECRRARASLESTLLRHGFQVYPYAYSNYNRTVDSLGSLFNFKLVSSRDAMVRANTRTSFVLTRNRLFERFQAKGYPVTAYYSNYLDFCGPGTACTSTVVYPANTIKMLERQPIPWLQKCAFVISSYLGADTFWTNVLEAHAPWLRSRLGRQIGPLNIAGLWPDRLEKDIIAANRPTAFFAHLLTPHYPFVYRRDGTLRDEREWVRVGSDTISCDRASYQRRYEQYAEQVQYLSTQIDAFLGALQRHPFYESSLIVFHGDHGSGVQLVSPQSSAEQVAAPAASLRTLLNDYSTLFAVKLPGSGEGRVIRRCDSIMRLIAETYGAAGELESAQDVYRFDKQNRPKAIPLGAIWAGN